MKLSARTISTGEIFEFGVTEFVSAYPDDDVLYVDGEPCALSSVTCVELEAAEAARDEAQRMIDALQGELNKALNRIAELERETRYFQSTDYAADQQLRQFEQTAPVDWHEEEWQDETPLGQVLDGQGDELEP